jgi:hypothetical protein
MFFLEKRTTKISKTFAVDVLFRKDFALDYINFL